MDDRDLLRYSRHILLDEIGIEGQRNLLAASVLLVGCGGLGAAAAPFLAAAGVGTLILADGDNVDESNLQRQTAFAESDIGRNKALALQQRLEQTNSRCRIEVLPHRLAEADLAAATARADVVLDCSDNYATRQALNAVCVRQKKPLVSGAAVRFSGQLAVYRADLPDSPCYACLFEPGRADDGACAVFGVFSPLVGIIGAAQAAEALKILIPAGQPSHGTLHTYHALESRWQSWQLPRNPDCPVCGRQHTE